MRLFVLLALTLGLLAGCASTPKFDTTGVDRALTPRAVVDGAAYSPSRRVLWGGVIVATRNLRDQTQLEVLAYPLERDGEPDVAASPQGRFLLLRDGYLEPVDYAPGRQVTGVGTVAGVEKGKVGEADYLYPVMKAEQMYLWPKEQPYQQRNPNVHFGIGVILH